MKRWPLLVLLALLSIPGVSAHAVPYASSPAQGTVLASSPDAVWIQFSEPVYDDGSFVRILDVDGKRWDTGQTIGAGDTPTITVEFDALPDGPYRLQWQTYSRADGHTVSGSIGFAVGEAAAPEATSATGMDPIHVAGRVLAHVGLAMGLGGLFYGRFVGPVRLPRSVGLVTALGAALVALAAGRASGLGVDVLSADPGHLLRMAGGLAAAAWAPAWILAALPWTFLGHAEGAALTVNEWIHIVAAGAWAGGLVILARRRDGDEALRFGRLAKWLLAATVITGVVAWRAIMGGLTIDLSTPWGQAFAVKLVLVATMLLAAAANRAALAGRPLPWKRLVAVEAGTGLGVLFAAGLMLSTTPFVVAAVEPDEGLHVFGEGEVFSAHGWMTPTPTAGVPVEVRLQVRGDALVENNTCGRDSCLRFAWQVSSDPGSRQVTAMEPVGDGWWVASDVLFASPGVYTWTVDVQTESVYRDQVVGDVTV